MKNPSRLTVLTAAAGIMLASTVTAACGSDATIAPTGAPAPAAAQHLPELGGMSTMDRIVANLNRNNSSMSTMDRVVADLDD